MNNIKGPTQHTSTSVYFTNENQFHKMSSSQSGDDDCDHEEEDDFAQTYEVEESLKAESCSNMAKVDNKYSQRAIRK